MKNSLGTEKKRGKKKSKLAFSAKNKTKKQVTARKMSFTPEQNLNFLY